MDGAALILDQLASAALSGAAPPAIDPASASASPSAAAPPDADKKGPYPPPSGSPTQSGPQGIRFDFNQGARVVLPSRMGGKSRVRLRDLDTGNILLQPENHGAFVSSAKPYYVRFSAEVSDLDAAGVATSVLSHEYDALGRDILIQFPIGTLGDILAWFPDAPQFAAEHGCRLTCAMSSLLIPLLRDTYPQINFVTHEEMIEQKLAETFDTTYCLGPFFDDKECIHQPTDFRYVGLHRTAGYILGVDPAEEAPRLVLPDESRPIPEPYVCIAVQSSTQSKTWMNPDGWRAVVRFLKRQQLPCGLHRQEPGARHRPGVEPHPERRRGRHRRSAAGGTPAVAAPCLGVCRAEQRVVMAGLSGGLSGGDDQRLHSSNQRVHHTVPGDQLARL
jgi:hypothetical protein